MDFFRNLLNGPETRSADNNERSNNGRPPPLPGRSATSSAPPHARSAASAVPNDTGSAATSPTGARVRAEETPHDHDGALFSGMAPSEDSGSMFSGMMMVAGEDTADVAQSQSDSAPVDDDGPSMFAFMSTSDDGASNAAPNSDSSTSFSFISGPEPEPLPFASANAQNPSPLSSPSTSVVVSSGGVRKKVGRAKRPGQLTATASPVYSNLQNLPPAQSEPELPTMDSSRDLSELVTDAAEERSLFASMRSGHDDETGGDQEEEKVEEDPRSVKARLRKYEEKVRSAVDEQSGMESTQRILRQRQRDHYLRLTQCQKELRDTEQKQAELVENEEYEAAEALAASMEALKAEVGSLQAKILDASEQWMKLEEQKRGWLSHVLEVRNAGVVDLLSLEKEQKVEVSACEQRLVEDAKDHEFRISSKQKIVDRSEEHVQRDMKGLMERESAIQQLIDSRTGDQIAERKIWSEKKEKVRQEIEELERQLALKRAEEADCDRELERIDSEIDIARTRYARDLTALDEEKKALEEEQKALKKHVKALNEAKKEWEEHGGKLKEQLNENEERLETIRKMIEDARKTTDEFQASVRASEARSAQEEILWEERQAEFSQFSNAKKEIAALRREIDERTEKVMETQAELRALELAIGSVRETVLPQCEREKVLAVKNRNFKGAKKLQEEMKSLQDKLKSDEEAREKALHALEELQTLNMAREKECDELQAKVDAEEKEADVARMAELQEQILVARMRLRRIQEHLPEFDEMGLHLEMLRAHNEYLHVKHAVEIPAEPELPDEEIEEETDNNSAEEEPKGTPEEADVVEEEVVKEGEPEGEEGTVADEIKESDKKEEEKEVETLYKASEDTLEETPEADAQTQIAEEIEPPADEGGLDLFGDLSIVEGEAEPNVVEGDILGSPHDEKEEAEDDKSNMIEEKETFLRELQAKVDALDEKLRDAVEMEDFDLADVLDVKLEGQRDLLRTLEAELTVLKAGR